MELAKLLVLCFPLTGIQILDRYERAIFILHVAGDELNPPEGTECEFHKIKSSYNESYHNITAGINELTSKITCYDNPSNITSKYYTVNVTGS